MTAALGPWLDGAAAASRARTWLRSPGRRCRRSRAGRRHGISGARRRRGVRVGARGVSLVALDREARPGSGGPRAVAGPRARRCPGRLRGFHDRGERPARCTPGRESLDAFRTAVNGSDGVVDVADALPADRRAVVWGWTASSLSLLLRGDASAGILVDRDPSFVPFPPAEARAQIEDEYTWGG